MTLFVLAVLSGAAASPRDAYALCSGSGCDRLQPYDTGCQYSDVVLQTKYADDYYVKLLYSSSCISNWGEEGYPVNSSLHYLSIASKSMANNDESVACGAAAGWCNTWMVDGNYQAQACGQDSAAGVCTDWF